MQLKGRVALITGGAVRVGRALTLALAAEGCHVFVHYGRSGQAAATTEREAQALGVECHTFSADLADEADVASILPAAQNRFGHVDILVNSAAIFPEQDEDALGAISVAAWNRLLNINLRAPFMLSQAFAAGLGDSRRGKIINITDARVRRPGADHFSYRLSKGAIWQMTEMLALTLAPRVTVNAVALGAILPPPGQDEQYLHDLAQASVPLRRPGNTDIVAENVLHLLRQDFLTGVIIPIDGGQFS